MGTRRYTYPRPAAPDRTAPPSVKIIWTADAIGARIGTSADFVRDVLAKEPGTPVKKLGTRYCAIEADLLAFFKAPPVSS